MASIHKDIPIDAHSRRRMGRGARFRQFAYPAGAGLRDSMRKLDGDARIVTFANGTVARELLVDCDEARRRLVYAINNERVSHYSASVQVLPEGAARSRLIWIVDVLPNAMAPYIDSQMDLGALAVQKTLGRAVA